MAANFWTSTHCRKWLFERKELDRFRDTNRGPFNDVEVDYLQEYFAKLILSLGKRMGWRQPVIATAMLFFKRFYVRSSFGVYDPRLVVPTVLYLAAKVEEMGQIRAETVTEHLRHMDESKQGEFPRFTAQQVYAYEFHLLQSLEFDLVVFHPYRSLIRYAEDARVQPEGIQTAWNIVNDTLRTNAALRFPPYIIAIAALYVANLSHKRDVRSWFGKLNVNLDEVREVVREVLAMYKHHCTRSEDTYQEGVKLALGKVRTHFQSHYPAYQQAGEFKTGMKRSSSVMKNLHQGSNKRTKDDIGRSSLSSRPQLSHGNSFAGKKVRR